jgi:hypothetical protein
MDGGKRPIDVRFRGGMWGRVKKVKMEPTGRELTVEPTSNGFKVMVKEEIDPVDTILRICR